MVESIKKNSIPLLFLSGVLTAYFAPALFMGDTFFFRDVLKFGIPEKWFELEMYRQGAMPLWNPHIYNGVPFFPLLHPSPAYPLNILLFAGEFPYGFNLFVVFHHFLLVFSVYALVRSWELGRGAAAAASLVALLGGYFLSLVSLGNQYVSAVWMPLILLSVQKYLKEGGMGWIIAALLSLVMQVLGGSPESCAMSTLMVLLASICITQEGKARWKQSLGVVSGLVVAALGLTAFQLIPTYRVVQHSVRAWQLDLDFHTQWSLQPDALWTFFFNRDFDTFMVRESGVDVTYLPSAYMGILPAFMVLMAFVFVRRKEVMFWTVMFWAGIFFALGKHNFIYMALVQIIPVLKMFHFPEKFLFLSAFSTVFITAYAWETWFGKPGRGGMLPWAMAFTLFAALMMAGAVLGVQDSSLGPNFLIMVLVVSMVLLSRSESFQYSHALPSALMVLLLVDLWAAHSRLVPFIDSQFYDRPSVAGQVLQLDSPPFRVFSGDYEKRYQPNNIFIQADTLINSHRLERKMARPNLGSIFGLDYTDGVMAIELNAIWIWEEMFSKSTPEKRKRMLERSNVRYQIQSGPDHSVRALTLKDALPRAFMVPRFQLGPEVRLLNTYFSESFDPLNEVLLDTAVEFTPSPHFAGTVEDIRYGPNRVEVLTRQEGNGFLVLLDSWFPGWTVRVDGQEASLLRANHLFRAVQLDAGSHRIQFEYVPEGYILGKTVSVVVLFLLLALAAAVLLRKPLAFEQT